MGWYCLCNILNSSFRIHFNWFNRIHFKLIFLTLLFYFLRQILKLVSAIFCQIFIFSPNDSPSKTMKSVFRWGTHLCISLFPSVCLSVHPLVAHHISGTKNHLIIIFVTPMQNDDISRSFFIFSKFSFFGLLGGWKCKK